MTVELGNINKGIPMGSYTPGEGGGGGTAKVTGVDPIAVTNGSVAIKIDEQTLQVNEQGELSANLDEIGSELNDLSGRVTAAEADILEKQGKLTARNPITIRTKEITNAKGFNTGTSTAATAQNVQKIWMSTSQNSGTIYIDSTFTLPIASYIAMPYTPGQIVKAPKSNAALAFGSFDDDNNFKLSLLFNLNYTSTSGFQLLGGPIYKTSSAATKDVLPNLDMTDFVYANGYGWRTRPTEAADSGDIYSTISDEDKQCAFFQVSSDSANALFIQEFWNLTNSRASTAVHRDSETNFAFAGHCNEIRENINTVLFLPMDTASSHDLTKLGVYNAPSDRMAWSNDSAWKSFRENKGTNFFNLGGTGVHNYLELNIGNGLSVQDNKLICTVEAPYAYTKSETDALLDTKEDVLNAVQPLVKTKTETNPVVGFTNNTGGKVWDTTTGSLSLSEMTGAGYCLSDAYGNDAVVTNSQLILKKYILIPYTQGQIVRVPAIVGSYSANYAVSLVNIDSNGNIDYISNYLAMNRQQPNLNAKGATYTQSSQYIGATTRISGASSTGDYSSVNLTSKITDGILIQLRVTDAKSVWASSIGRLSGSGYSQCYTSTDKNIINRLKDVNAILLTRIGSTSSSSGMGVSETAPYNLSLIQVFENDGTTLETLTDQVGFVNSHTNIYDATKNIINNSLSLTIGNGLSVVEGALTASSTTPANMVTTDTAQAITGIKTFTGPIKITNGTYTREVAKVNTNGGVPYLYLGQGDSRMYLHTGTPIKRLDNTGGEHTILESSNLGSYVDGTTITYTDNKLSAVSSGSSVEKYGIEGDYSSKYGILECPKGIFTVSGMQMTLQPGVVMQCAGSESKTTNSSAMAHTVTSTSDFDIFYTSGQFIEATQVVFSTEEPENGATGYLAWWDPSRADKKWQFKSNDSGNVWAAAAACRLAHVHTDGTSITRVDYIGNRQMDDSVFVDSSTLDGISFKKITQSAYEALATPDANTLYIIVG